MPIFVYRNLLQHTSLTVMISLCYRKHCYFQQSINEIPNQLHMPSCLEHLASEAQQLKSEQNLITQKKICPPYPIQRPGYLFLSGYYSFNGILSRSGVRYWTLFNQIQYNAFLIKEISYCTLTILILHQPTTIA